MTKESYLTELAYLLAEEEYQSTDEACLFYGKFIDNLLQEGQTMDQVVITLGTPQQVSDELILDEEEPLILPKLPENETVVEIEPEIIENNEAAFKLSQDEVTNKPKTENKAAKPEKKPNFLSRTVSFLFSLMIILPFWLIVGFILFSIVWVLIAVIMSGFASGLILSTFILLTIGFFLLLLSGTVLLNRIRRTIANLFKGGY